jgi:hypothetical protein
MPKHPRVQRVAFAPHDKVMADHGLKRRFHGFFICVGVARQTIIHCQNRFTISFGSLMNTT